MATPLKRAPKPSTKSAKKSKTLTLDHLKSLGHDLLSSRSHLNNLPILLSYLSPTAAPHLAAESLISIQSFFLPLLPQIPSSSAASAKSTPADDEAAADSVFRNWLKERFDEFVDKLVDIAVSGDSVEALRDVALEAVMDFVKLGKGGRFQTVIYHRFLSKVVHAASDVDPLVELLATKYFKYLDCRYFTYTSMDKILKNFPSVKDSEKVTQQDGEDSAEKKLEHAIHKAHNILSHFPPLELDDEQSFVMWSELGILSKDGEKISSYDSKSDTITQHKSAKGLQTNQIMKRIKAKFTKAWLSFLKLPLPLDVYKEVLVSLHQNVIPYMANPSILCDFLTKSYDIGGVISVMALSGLFILMTKHGLEYPKFYEKLYALLTPAVFMAKHRAVFFQLLDSCLKSTYLPAYLAAAFAKKLSRLALSVPPAGELIIIAMIHNLLRRHPSINFLVHQIEADQNGEEAKESASTVTVSQSLGCDPFDMEESDPVKSKAMRSSLWEIETLRHHYSPAVSRFVASLENDLTVRAKTSEVSVKDFSSGSYATVFRDEIRRRIKQVPLAFYRTTPCSLFSESDFPGWSFGENQSGTEVSKDEANGVIT